jgi:Leucine-rich repeat (LRR) protein
MPSVVNKIQDFSSSVSGNAVSGVNNVLIPLSAEPETNFDVTADWSLASVTDQASFEGFLTSQGATSVTITYFDLTAGRLQAFIDVEGLVALDLNSIEVSEVLKISGFDSSIEEVYLYLNNLTSFNPLIALPNSLLVLDLSSNQITEFNPDIALPSNLYTLTCFRNNLSSFNPDIALPSSLFILEINENQITEFNPDIALPSNLDVLALDSNQLTFFNPSLPLPVSLMSITLGNNLITTAGYSDSEPWATAQPSFTNTCTIDLQNNTDSITGTNLETILLTKNTTINP